MHNVKQIELTNLPQEDRDFIKTEGITFEDFMHDSDDHFECEECEKHYESDADMSDDCLDYDAAVCRGCEDDFIENALFDPKKEHSTY